MEKQKQTKIASHPYFVPRNKIEWKEDRNKIEWGKNSSLFSIVVRTAISIHFSFCFVLYLFLSASFFSSFLFSISLCIVCIAVVFYFIFFGWYTDSVFLLLIILLLLCGQTFNKFIQVNKVLVIFAWKSFVKMSTTNNEEKKRNKQKRKIKNKEKEKRKCSKNRPPNWFQIVVPSFPPFSSAFIYFFSLPFMMKRKRRSNENEKWNEK